MSDNETFGDIIDRMKYGNTPSEEEEATTKAEGSEDPVGESPSEEPEVQSEDDSTEEPPQETEDDAEDEGEAPSDEAGGEETKSDDEEDDEVFVEIDGQQVSLAQVREWRDSGLRLDDYTRKTQQTAAERKALDERDALLEEIVTDKALSEFVRAHPEVLPRLLKDPDNVRAILGNAEEVEKLWDDYETVKSNPRLAERFMAEPKVAEEELILQRQAENAVAVAKALDDAVDFVAQKYEGLDAEAVKTNISRLGRLPESEDASPQEWIDGFGRLYGLMFVEAEDGVRVDTTLIEREFEMLKSASQKNREKKKTKASEHNETIDRALKDEGGAPSTGSGNDAPAPVTAPDEDNRSFDDIVHGLYGHK